MKTRSSLPEGPWESMHRNGDASLHEGGPSTISGGPMKPTGPSTFHPLTPRDPRP